jgi:hypothetical protein
MTVLISVRLNKALYLQPNLPMMTTDIEGYSGIYQVNEHGEVFSHSRKRGNLRPAVNSNGYLSVILCKDGEYKSFTVHRLVAISFIPNPYNLPQVNHIDGDKLNNDVSNLEWVSNQANSQHRFNSLGHKGSNRGKHGNHSRALLVTSMDRDRNVVRVYATLTDAFIDKHWNQSIRRAADTGQMYHWLYWSIEKASK